MVPTTNNLIRGNKPLSWGDGKPASGTLTDWVDQIHAAAVLLRQEFRMLADCAARLRGE